MAAHVQPFRRRRMPMLLEAALAYAARGWPVLPLHAPTERGCSCRRLDCPSPGKHPRTRRGLKEASTSRAQLEAWWARWPGANVGIATGGLIVVDVDGPEGRRALGRLQRAHERLPETLRARSARGEHLYFAAGEHQIPNSVGRLAEGVDVRGRGGYVIAPPSRHAGGHDYRWSSQRPLATVPPWLASLLAPRAPARRTALPAAAVNPAAPRARRYFDAAVARELERVASARPGTRNDTLNRAAFRLGQLVGGGLGTCDELAERLQDAAQRAGLPESEAAATIASGLQAGARQPRPLPDPARRSPSAGR